MKITPLEIRQKIFEKTLRGYNREDVSAFLLTLSREWEYLQDELRTLHTKLSAMEQEVAKLREVEDSLYKTLKTAERTGANVIEQANKEAELCLKETHMKADAIVIEAQSKAKDIINSSENLSKQMLDEMEYQLTELIQNYKTVEISKKDLMSDLKHTANEMLEKVDRVKEEVSDFDPTQHLIVAKQKRREIPNTDSYSTSYFNDKTDRTPSSKKTEEQTESNSSESFFDKIQ